MKVKLLATLLCVSFSVAMSAQVKEAPMPELVRHQDGQYALYVDAKPFFILGGQSGNSNNWPAMHPQLFDKADIKLFMQMINKTKYVGEIGLDFSSKINSEDKLKMLKNLSPHYYSIFEVGEGNNKKIIEEKDLINY